MKTVAIVNPLAGFRRTPGAWPTLLEQVGAEASQVVTWWTKGPGHAEFLAGQAKKSGFERVIAVGGDGTAFEVVNGLWWEVEGRLPGLGIVPFGTGCDYVRNFDMGATRLDNLKNALGETTLNVDALVFHLVGWHQKAISRISLNFLGSGLDARVIARHRRQKIPVPGKLSYFFHGFQELCRLKPFRLSGEIDGKPFKSLSNIIVLGLGRFFGGGMMITPSASPQAGRCQVVWDQQLTRIDLLKLIRKVYHGKHLFHPKVLNSLAQKVKIVVDPPGLVEADGELIGWTPLEVEVCLQAFRVAAKKISFSTS